MSPDTFVFDTTHHAIWAEEVAAEHHIPAEVIPAPAGAGAKCNLALRTLPERVHDLRNALESERIQFRLWPEDPPVE